jgi:hypothetical protein
MPASDSATSIPTAAQPITQDAQTLIALLGTLMPLLLRLQSQIPALFPLLEPGNPVPNKSLVEQQAAVTLIQDITADSLRALAAYVETYAGQQAGVEYCVPIVTQAAHCFAAHDYAQTFALVLQTYCMLTAVRAANPQLPPVRGLGAGFAGLTSSETSIH